ncbi:MAG: SHOCT domain-containing protein [Lachnospiraceae bacterium]|nr:SHOCT domain-containing protein [Lachnospiraceae bacterium]
MEKILDALAKMPAFLAELFTEHPVIAVAGVMAFLLALMVPGRIGSLIRKIVVLANVMFAMAGGFMGRGQNGYQIICLSAISLITLFIVRLIVRIVAAIKQRRIDARIEERALAKAAKRRGSFKKRRGYSGEPRDTWDDDFVPPEESQIEIRQVIENEISEGKARNEAAAQQASFISDDKIDYEAMPETDEPFDAWNTATWPVDETEAANASLTSEWDAMTTRAHTQAGQKGPLFVPLQSPEETMAQSGTDDLPEGVFYARPRPNSGISADQYLAYDINAALKRLAELRDNGIMTDEEFEDKKAELLARMK